MKKLVVIAISSSLLLSACTTSDLTNNNFDKTAIGASLGALGGALGGLLLSGGSDKRKNVLIGAGIGALVGGGIGLYQDNQEQELRKELQNTGAKITRQGDKIIISLPSNVTFATGQSAVRSEFFPALNAIARTLSKYNQTLLDVNGHTDSVGSFSFNQTLSEQRALSVAQYVSNRGIDNRRLRIQGFGESRPIASNGSANGRSANRRVEIAIIPLEQ